MDAASRRNYRDDISAKTPASRTGRTNSLAIAALLCGIAQLTFPLAFIAAIILGHKARRQIRRTREDGYGLATAGLALGYFSLALIVLVPIIGLVATASVLPGLR